MSTVTTRNTVKQNIAVTRVIAAPVELVWKSWTEPERIMQWWGPRNYISPSCEIDFREGGNYLFCMRAPQDQGGLDYYTTGTYQKIVPMERIEFTASISDKDGNRVNSGRSGISPDFPEEIRTVATFKELLEGITEITITEHNLSMGQMAVFALIGLHQSMDKLAEAVQVIGEEE